MVFVGTIVRDVQFAVAVYEGQVAIAIESTGMASADGDKVAVVDIVDRGGGVTEHGNLIGIHGVATKSNVTAGKDSVVDDDTTLLKDCFRTYSHILSDIDIVPIRWPCVSRLCLECIQVGGGDIIANGIGLATVADAACFLHLQPRLHEYLTVLGEDIMSFS